MSPASAESTQADLMHAMVFAGAIGSGAIAAFFLILDLAAGQPLATPLTMGAALFTGELPRAGASLRLDLVALYSLVHLAMFSVAGASFALVASRMEEARFLSTILGTGLFLTFTAGVLALNALVAVDLVAAIGVTPLLLGNAVASGVMTVFYLRVFTANAAWLPIPSTLLGDQD